MHPWRSDHFTSINAGRVWRIRVGVQVSKRKFYTHIHLDYTRVEFLSFIYIYIYIYIKLCSKIYNIFNIFLFKLFVISNTSICKTYLFEFILTLSLALLNSLGLLSSEKKNFSYVN